MRLSASGRASKPSHGTRARGGVARSCSASRCSLRSRPSRSRRGFCATSRGPAPAACDRRGAAPGRGRRKFGDRVAGERAATGPSGRRLSPRRGVASRTEVPVSQRAILYEENQADPQTPSRDRRARRLAARRPQRRTGAAARNRGPRRPSRFRTRSSHAQPRDPAQPRSGASGLAHHRTHLHDPERPRPNGVATSAFFNSRTTKRCAARRWRACRCPSRKTCSCSGCPTCRATSSATRTCS